MESGSKRFLGLYTYMEFSCLSDVELVELTLTGHRTAFDELMRRHQTRLFAFLQQASGSNQSETEDLVQDTFLKAYMRLDKFNYREFHSNKAFQTWLFTIGRNTWLNSLRKNRHGTSVLFSSSETLSQQTDNLPDSNVTPAQQAEQNDCQNHLWSQLRTVLTEPQWTVLWFQYVEGYSLEEIATALHKKIQSVKALLHRAKYTLKNHPELF